MTAPQPEALLPCPFCGSEAEIDEESIGAILCSGCGFFYEINQPVEDAIAAWNRRADSQAQSDILTDPNFTLIRMKAQSDALEKAQSRIRTLEQDCDKNHDTTIMCLERDLAKMTAERDEYKRGGEFMEHQVKEFKAVLASQEAAISKCREALKASVCGFCCDGSGKCVCKMREQALASIPPESDEAAKPGPGVMDVQRFHAQMTAPSPLERARQDVIEAAKKWRKYIPADEGECGNSDGNWLRRLVDRLAALEQGKK